MMSEEDPTPSPVATDGGEPVVAPTGNGGVPAPTPEDAGTPGPGPLDAASDAQTLSADASMDGPTDSSIDTGPCVPCADGSCVDTTTDPGNCGGCGITCGGQCTGGRCLVTLATASEPIQLAIDAQNVYFTAYDGTVDKVPVDGGAVTVLAEGIGYPWGITIDANAVYFGVPNFITGGVNAWVGSVPIGGGAPTTLASNTAGGRLLAVLDGILYWDSGGYETSTDAEITRVPVYGGTPTPFVPIKPGGFYSIGGMVPRDGQLFFTEDGVGIESLAPEATTPTPIANVAAGSIALDDANIYTVSTDGLLSISRATGAVTTLVPGTQQEITNSPTSIATDGVNVYWTNYYGITQSTVLRVPVGGGPTTTLASGQNDTSSVVLDSTSVYWIAGSLIQKLNKN